MEQPLRRSTRRARTRSKNYWRTSMPKDYFVDPLPPRLLQNPLAIRQQLVGALGLTVERDEQWLRNEVAALGVDDLAVADLLLGRMSPSQLVSAFHQANPEVNL